MWRCHCGETNLNKAMHCRQCSGSRSTHEEKEYQPKPRERRKTVNVGFFGIGMGDDRGREAGSRRIMNEGELDAYYRRARRRLRLQWLVYALAAMAVVIILVWQVLRSPY